MVGSGRRPWIASRANSFLDFGHVPLLVRRVGVVDFTVLERASSEYSTYVLGLMRRTGSAVLMGADVLLRAPA